ncbi:MAG: aldehyde dehydrogenase [Desulfobacterales bacterium]
MEDIKSILANQKKFFDSGESRDVGFRTAQLDALHSVIRDNQKKILEALHQDLSKSTYEGYLTEVGLVLDEIRFVRKHLAKWVKPKRVRTHLFQFPGASYIYSEPYGVVLIISPWNYPFQLVVAPLIGSVAAGNCSVLKPSEFAPATAGIISEIIGQNFDRSFIAVIEGDAQVSSALLDEKFDYIFFTGGAEIGKIVMAAAARRLTPVTLELGGKSPCIVNRDADSTTAARRIVSGKFINAGQTCIAPDYLLVHRSIKAELIDRMQTFISRFYGPDPRQSPDYPRIINEKHFQRLETLLRDGKIIAGGRTDKQELYIAPTILDEVTWEDTVMQQEIFGPILPVIAFDDLSEAIPRIKSLPPPLTLYLFTNDERQREKIIQDIPFGGGCINDTLLHFTNPDLPFGGIGSSGIGSYHGKKSFDTFSHQKSIFRKYSRFDAPLRYPPYGNKLRILKKIMR